MLLLGKESLCVLFLNLIKKMLSKKNYLVETLVKIFVSMT